MNMYVVFALFLLSSAVILACLDHLKMRLARNLFLLLVLVLIVFLPFVVSGSEIVFFRREHVMDNLADKSVALIDRVFEISSNQIIAVTLIFSVLAVLVSISTIILVMQTAKAICKLVQSIASKRQHPKVPQKQNYQRKLVHSKIQYKRILYLRFCRLIS